MIRNGFLVPGPGQFANRAWPPPGGVHGPFRPPGSGAQEAFGISTELMMYTVALAVWTLPQTTLVPLTV